MTIHETIKEEIKTAMKAKEQVRLDVLRGILTSFTNELVANKRKPDEELSDEDAKAVIKRVAKQRKDSIEQFKSGGRDDLVEKEEKELKFIEPYLPKMMSEDEIRKIAENKKNELGIDDKSKMGILMGAVMKETKGQADGVIVKNIVESLFL